MKVIVLLLFTCTVLIASAVPLDSNTKFEDEDEQVLSNVARNSGNQYLLFTRINPTSGQTLIADRASVFASNFNPNWPTVAVCHGYTQSQNSELNQVIRDAFFERGNYNIIILDWSHIAQGNYATAIISVPSVGQGLGALLLFLNQLTGAPLGNMHVIGFSLGGHVAGNAGRYTGGRVSRVTGLDPVSPIWAINSNRISSTDGVYVEIIHTYGNNGATAWGDTDFYVNGGGSQPGCILSFCSHDRSWQTFAASVKYNHLIGRRCNSQAEIVSASCSGPEMPMGTSDASKSGSGLYYVIAGSTYPY